MKKMLTLALALLMILTCAAACAETLAPIHAVSMENYGTGDSTMKAHFDPQNAFDAQNNMTFTVLQDDLYPASALKALKAGDKIVILGKEETVQSVQETETGMILTTENGECDFYYADETKENLTTSEDDNPYTSEMGTYIFPLAEQVTVRVWVNDENGNPKPELEEKLVPAAEVKDIFAARSDSEKADFMDCMNSTHVTIRVQDGKVGEITVDWGSDD